ncbi:MAG: ABC transporter permease [Anaerolineae bacterium]|nr:ABC transporter permease [Anaerolineae bacterium]
MAQGTLTRPVRSEVNIDVAKMRRDLRVRQIGKVGYFLNALAAYFFLWAPILVLVLFSFNDSRSVAQWQGFTTRWYTGIFENVAGTSVRGSTTSILDALRNSLVIGSLATLFATVLGTALALAIVRYKFPGKRVLDSILYLPVIIPEIAQAISLALFFKIVFDTINLMRPDQPPATYGYGTIIIGHVVFNIAYVVIVVRARLADMNPRLEEAARDLGANEWQTFWRVTFPLMLPGIVAGALLAFTLSLDDYIVTAMNRGIGDATLTVVVFGMMRRGVSPEVNAISTLMIIFSILLIGISLLLQGRSAVTGRG